MDTTDQDRRSESSTGSGSENFFDQDVVRVFNEPETLRDFYTPPEIVEREKVMHKLFIRFNPILEGDKTAHALLEGPNGTGKTAASQYIAEEFVNNEKSGDATAIHLNCGSVESEYQLGLQIVNEIRHPDDEMNHGHDTDKVIKEACTELDQLGDTVLLILDEVDRVPEMNNLLYHITRSQQKGTYINNASVSVIFTGNNLQFADNLRSDIASSLVDKDRIIFDPYDAKELEKILQQRVDLGAFFEKAIEDDVVSYTAARAAQRGGDARYGLQMLLKAGEHAMEINEAPVTTDHIDVAQQRLDRQRVSELIQQTHDREQLALFTLITTEVRGNEEPTMSDVADEYETIGKEMGYDQEYGTITRYINTLIENGLVEEIDSTGPGKRVYLSYPVDAILSEMNDRLVSKLGDYGYVENTTDSDSVAIHPPNYQTD